MMTLIGCWHFTHTEIQMESLRVACAIDRARVVNYLEFALKEKQFACDENIADGRYVMGILPTEYGETLIYTILPRVLDMLPGSISWHTLTWCLLLPFIYCWSSEERLHMMGLGAVHPKVSGSTIVC